MKVIIVEDEKDTLEEIVMMVRDYKPLWEIFPFYNPEDAWRIGDGIDFDVALLDMQMPVITGLELAEKLSNHHNKQQVIFVTAYNHFAAEAFELNAIDYVLKPIRKERLYKALDKITIPEGDRRQTEVREDNHQIHVKFFKKFHILIGKDIIKWNRKRTAEILAYLIINSKIPVHKELLCEMLWPEQDPEKSLVNLQTHMYQLRKNLSNISRDQLRIDYSDNCYTLHIAIEDIDVNLFKHAFKKAVNEEFKNIETLYDALTLYENGFLEEEGWEWALEENRQLEIMFKKLLESLIEYLIEHQQINECLSNIYRWVSLGYTDMNSKYILWIKKYFGDAELTKFLKIQEHAIDN